jgi:outer membrane protein OmpA-like peptidoglycan-associated protein
MNKRKERALEVFLYVTFAIALFAGVGNTKSDTSIFPINFEFNKGEGDAVLGYQQALQNDDLEEGVELQSRINFVGNNDKVNALGRRELFKHAEVLRTNPHLILNIIARADNRGSAAYHLALSEKRAKQVYELLVFYGTPEEQLIVDVSGDAIPGGYGANIEQNRYVELQYLSTLSVGPQR